MFRICRNPAALRTHVLQHVQKARERLDHATLDLDSACNACRLCQCRTCWRIRRRLELADYDLRLLMGYSRMLILVTQGKSDAEIRRSLAVSGSDAILDDPEGVAGEKSSHMKP